MDDLEKYPSSVNKEFGASSEIVKGKDGWLSPTGVFYPCDTTEHDAAARFLLSKKSPEHDYIQEHSYDFWNEDPERTRLSKIGYVLVHGTVVAPDKFANLNMAQLEMLKKSNIPIIDPIDNSKCSPEFVLEIVNSFRDKVEAILNTDAYNETFKHVERIFEDSGIERKDLNTRYHNSRDFTDKYNRLIDRYNNMTWEEREEYHTKGPFPSNFAFESVATIENFLKSPFEGSINITDDEKLTEKVFEIITDGYSEGVKIESYRHKWMYREIPTSDPNIFITVSRSYYHHDGLTGGMTGTVNEDIYARIQTRYQIETELSKKISSIVSTPDERGNLPTISKEGTQELYKL